MGSTNHAIRYQSEKRVVEKSALVMIFKLIIFL
jgi:hypothetical protein